MEVDPYVSTTYKNEPGHLKKNSNLQLKTTLKVKKTLKKKYNQKKMKIYILL